MVANPIQREKRNAMIFGGLAGLIVAALIFAVVYFLFIMPNMKDKGSGQLKQIAVLNKDIKSGNEITTADVTLKTVDATEAPTDAVVLPNISVITNIDLTRGAILTQGMLSESSEKLTKDQRIQEYNMIALPSTLAQGDFIDIRFQLPDGGDYIVVSKKCVQRANATTVWLKMNEEEILTMSNAIIEYYIMAGSKLYADVYTNAGMQEASIPSYTPNDTVTKLISENPNITSEVGNDKGRFTTRLKALRNQKINTALREYNDTGLENLETKIQEEIKNLQESRESYFGALNASSIN